MENGAIPNERINASSEKNPSSTASQARLNWKKTPSKEGSWTAGNNDNDQWLRIFFGGGVYTVTGIATQGKNGGNSWVTSYKLQYEEYVGDHSRHFIERGEDQHKVR